MNEVPFLIWSQIWQVTVVAAIVFIAAKVFAKNRPHLAHALWVLVLIKCIAPPVFSSHVSPFSWISAETTAAVPTQDLADAMLPFGDDTEPFVGPTVINATGLSKFHGNQNVHSDFTGTRNADAALANATMDWKLVLCCIWLAGTVVGALMQFIRYLRFTSRIHRSETVDSEAAENLVFEVSQTIGLKRRVKLNVTRALVSPAVIGLVRPTILLPAKIVEQQQPDQLRPLIAHELIHVRRGDLWWAFLQTVAGSLFWFHPLVRFAVAAVTRESERSCDEETVASLGCKPAEYAYSLLQILEQKHTFDIAPAVPGVKPFEVTSDRLERVMKLGHGSHKRTPWWTWIVLLLCSAVLLPGAGLLVAQEPEKATEKLKENRTGTLLPIVEDYEGPPFVVEAYEVADILEKLREKHPEVSDPELELLLKSHVDGYLASASRESGKLLTSQMYEGKLVANLTQDQHDRLGKFFAKVRAHGLRQIVFEVRFLERNTNFGDGVKWVDQKSATFSGTEGHLVRKSHSGEIALASLELDVSKAPMDQVNVASLIDSAPDKDPLHELKDASSTNCLVQQALINDKQLSELLRTTGQGVVEAPTVVVFDGQTAIVNDLLNRPFITSVNPIVSDDAIAHQPVFSILSEGTQLNLMSKIDDAGAVEVSGNVVMSTIVDVDSVAFSEKPMAGKTKSDKIYEYGVGVTIQMPSMKMAQLKFDAGVVDGQTLCLRTKTPQKGKLDPVLLLTPRVVEVDSFELQSQPQSPSNATEEGEKLPQTYYTKDDIQFVANRSAAAKKRAFEAACKKHDVTATSDEVDEALEAHVAKFGLSKERFIKLVTENTGKTEAEIYKLFASDVCLAKLPEELQRRFTNTAVEQPILIQSQSPENDWSEEESKFHGSEFYPVIQKTDVAVTVEEDVTYFRGTDLQMVVDGEVLAAADKLEYAASGAFIAIELQGNAELNIGGTMKADSIRYESEDSLSVRLTGNARIWFKGSKQPNIVGDSLKVYEDGRIIVDGTELGVRIQF